jgi:hypothetical protein
MGVVPKADTKGDLETWMKDYLGTGSVKKEHEEASATAKSQTYLHFSRHLPEPMLERTKHHLIYGGTK